MRIEAVHREDVAVLAEPGTWISPPQDQSALLAGEPEPLFPLAEAGIADTLQQEQEKATLTVLGDRVPMGTTQRHAALPAGARSAEEPVLGLAAARRHALPASAHVRDGRARVQLHAPPELLRHAPGAEAERHERRAVVAERGGVYDLVLDAPLGAAALRAAVGPVAVPVPVEPGIRVKRLRRIRAARVDHDRQRAHLAASAVPPARRHRGRGRPGVSRPRRSSRRCSARRTRDAVRRWPRATGTFPSPAVFRHNRAGLPSGASPKSKPARAVVTPAVLGCRSSAEDAAAGAAMAATARTSPILMGQSGD